MRETAAFRPGADGFVLPAVLWIVALLALAGAGFARWVEERAALAHALQQRVESEREFADATALALYWLVSRPKNARGIDLGQEGNGTKRTPPSVGGSRKVDVTPRIGLDGRPYRLGVETLVGIQDHRGLIDLSEGEEAVLAALLGTFGVVEKDRPVLLQRLKDYVDPDDLRGVNGAEKADYAAAKRPPPANRPLLSLWEAQAILGWDRPELWRADSLPGAARIGGGAEINPLTAPASVLRAAYGLEKNVADKLVAARREAAPTSVPALAAASGVKLPDLPNVSLVPGAGYRITLRSTASHLARSLDLTLSPDSGRAPYRIDIVLDHSDASREDHADIAEIPAFPDPTPKASAP